MSSTASSTTSTRWRSPTTATTHAESTNVPVVTNLRADPWERYQTESEMYGRWWGEKLFTLVPAAAIVGEFLQTFVEYPPSQRSGTFAVDQALQALQEGGRS